MYDPQDGTEIDSMPEPEGFSSADEGKGRMTMKPCTLVGHAYMKLSRQHQPLRAPWQLNLSMWQAQQTSTLSTVQRRRMRRMRGRPVSHPAWALTARMTRTMAPIEHTRGAWLSPQQLPLGLFPLHRAHAGCDPVTIQCSWLRTALSLCAYPNVNLSTTATALLHRWCNQHLAEPT